MWLVMNQKRFQYAVPDAELDEVIDLFVKSAENRKIQYGDLIRQMEQDHDLTAVEKRAFRRYMIDYERYVEWAFEHHYDERKILRRLPDKMYKSIAHTESGPMEFVTFVRAVADAYTNESSMEALCV